ncbi:MAG: DUF4292 domain-containing protein [Bacteroidetes bacterium]|nr:MAG: DUF4292 domain-containing protein [Bacteroidota bacterium]
MNKHLHFSYIILGLCLLGLLGCKSGRGLIGKKEKVVSWKHTLEKTETERVQFQTLAISGKANVAFPSQNLSMGLSYRLNMIKDSLIWIRISKLGIEGIRALITRDSIFVIDRTNNLYHVSNFQLAEKFTGLQGDFGMIQDLLLGNLHLVPPVDELKVEKKQTNPLIVTGEKSGTLFKYLIDSRLHKLTSMEAFNPIKGLHSVVTYGDFEAHGRTRMPLKTHIQVLAPDTLELEFQHRRVEINPERFSIKFNVPRSYERVEYN